MSGMETDEPFELHSCCESCSLRWKAENFSSSPTLAVVVVDCDIPNRMKASTDECLERELEVAAS